MKDKDIERFEKEIDVYFINDAILQEKVDELYRVTYGKNISKSDLRKFLIYVYQLNVLGLLEKSIAENWSEEKVKSAIESSKARLQRAINRIFYKIELALKSKDGDLKIDCDHSKDEKMIIASAIAGVFGLTNDFNTEFLESYTYYQILYSLKNNPQLIEDIRKKISDYFEGKQKM